MSTSPSENVTDLLRRVAHGDEAATNRLAEVLHADLRHLAARFLAGERQGHTLQPTALVHELWLRLMPDAAMSLQGRAHFMAIAARVMRRILVDHARARRTEKRGGQRQRVSLGDVPPGVGPESDLDEALDLHDAIDQLARDHPRQAQVIELRAFGGLTIEETSEAMGIAASTVQEDALFAKAWLARALRRR